MIKCNFCKFSACAPVSISKLHSDAVSLVAILNNFSEQPFLRKFLNDYFRQGTTY